MALDFQSDEVGSAVVVSVKGDVDMDSSPELQKQLIGLFRNDQKAIVVDLSGVSYIDSSGIATFVEGLQWSHSTQNKFRLVGLSPCVKDIFEIARLTTVFDIFDSREKALEGI